MELSEQVYDSVVDEVVLKHWAKICFVPTGECFPDGDKDFDGASMVPLTGESLDCGKAIHAFYLWKVRDSNDGGRIKMTFRGIQPVGDKDCFVGSFIPYPHYDSQDEPDGIMSKLATFQECWFTDFDVFGSILESGRCATSTNTTYPNLKGVSAAAGFSEVLQLIVVSGDGISLVPITAIPPEIASQLSNSSTDGLKFLIDSINRDTENPKYWSIWNWGGK